MNHSHNISNLIVIDIKLRTNFIRSYNLPILENFILIIFSLKPLGLSCIQSSTMFRYGHRLSLVPTVCRVVNCNPIYQFIELLTVWIKWNKNSLGLIHYIRKKVKNSVNLIESTLNIVMTKNSMITNLPIW